MGFQQLGGGSLGGSWMRPSPMYMSVCIGVGWDSGDTLGEGWMAVWDGSSCSSCDRCHGRWGCPAFLPGPEPGSGADWECEPFLPQAALLGPWALPSAALGSRKYLFLPCAMPFRCGCVSTNAGGAATLWKSEAPGREGPGVRGSALSPSRTTGRQCSG